VEVADVEDNTGSNGRGTLSGTFDKSYKEKKLNPAIYRLNDKDEIIYFEDSLDGNFCSLYIKSAITVIDSTGKPNNYSSIVDRIENEHAVLIINGANVKVASEITDSEIMLPTYLGAFNRSDRNFLLIKMNLVSGMGGDYWYNLLLELDSTGHVIYQKGIETSGEISFSQVIEGID
jgi:hypothetical protein